MAHTYSSLLAHVVFSTKERRRMIPEPVQPALWAYMGGIARNNHMKALAVGGVADHAHILLSLPAVMPVARAVQLIKAGSSKWMHDDGHRLFQLQNNYASFSIGVSQVSATVAYIQSQPEHHKKRSFETELRQFLRKHGIKYDERYVFG